MTISAGDILKTSINFLLGDGTLYQNVYHHRRVGIGIISDETHVTSIEDWAEAMYAEIDDQVADDVTGGLSQVDRVEWVVDKWEIVEAIGAFVMDFTPTQAANIAMPNQVSAFVTFKTERPKTVGRKFLFPLTESGFVNGTVTGAAVTTIVAWADDAVNNVEVSFPLDYLVPGVVRTGVDDFLDFTLAIVTNSAGTQRRRRLGYGA